jgi:4'-phosphopantetheinyl transferase
VDLELVEPIGEVRALARAVLSPRELSHLDALPEPQRLRAFYDAWTRKEAFLKALGCGLNRPPDGVEVAFGPGEPPRVLSSSVDPSEPGRFAIHAFEPRAGYVGAVAFAGRARRVRELTWHWA